MVVSEAATDQQIAQWHKDGAVVIEDFFCRRDRAHLCGLSGPVRCAGPG